MSKLHDRMPLVLVLVETDWRLWLGEETGDAAELLRPAPDGTLRAWPVSPRVNSLKLTPSDRTRGGLRTGSDVFSW